MTQKTYDSQAVLDFLAQNPDFLLEQGDALYQLKLPSSKDDRVISFIERQVERLQQENKKTQEQLHTLISNAQRSETISQQTHLWACKLIMHPLCALVPVTLAAALANTFGTAVALCPTEEELPLTIGKIYRGPIANALYDFTFRQLLPTLSWVAMRNPENDIPMCALIV